MSLKYRSATAHYIAHIRYDHALLILTLILSFLLFFLAPFAPFFLSSLPPFSFDASIARSQKPQEVVQKSGEACDWIQSAALNPVALRAAAETDGNYYLDHAYFTTYCNKLMDGFTFEQHSDHARFIHPLQKKMVKLGTSKNQSRGAATRFWHEWNELEKIQAKMSELVKQRADSIFRLIDLEIESRIYSEVAQDATLVRSIESSIKVDLAAERKKKAKAAAKAIRKETKARRESLLVAGGLKRKRVISDSDFDSDDEEETEEDKAFVDRSKVQPKKIPRSEMNRTTISVTIVDQSGNPYDFTVALAHTVASLKEQISHVLDLEVSKIRLTHRRKPMIDDQTLAQHSVSHTDFIYMKE